MARVSTTGILPCHGFQQGRTTANRSENHLGFAGNRLKNWRYALPVAIGAAIAVSQGMSASKPPKVHYQVGQALSADDAQKQIDGLFEAFSGQYGQENRIGAKSMVDAQKIADGQFLKEIIPALHTIRLGDGAQVVERHVVLGTFNKPGTFSKDGGRLGRLIERVTFKMPSGQRHYASGIYFFDFDPKTQQLALVKDPNTKTTMDGFRFLLNLAPVDPALDIDFDVLEALGKPIDYKSLPMPKTGKSPRYGLIGVSFFLKRDKYGKIKDFYPGRYLNNDNEEIYPYGAPSMECRGCHWATRDFRKYSENWVTLEDRKQAIPSFMKYLEERNVPPAKRKEIYEQLRQPEKLLSAILTPEFHQVLEKKMDVYRPVKPSPPKPREKTDGKKGVLQKTTPFQKAAAKIRQDDARRLKCCPAGSQAKWSPGAPRPHRQWDESHA